MQIQIPYNQVKDRYPVQIQETIQNLRKGKSISKNAHPKELAWYLNFSIAINGCMNGTEFAKQLTSGTFPAPLTPQQKYEEHKAGVHCSLQAVKGKGYWNCKTPITPLPQEIDNWLTANRDKEIKEEQRVAAMTPKQNRQEIASLLKQLGKSKSFSVFYAPVKEQ